MVFFKDVPLSFNTTRQLLTQDLPSVRCFLCISAQSTAFLIKAKPSVPDLVVQLLKTNWGDVSSKGDVALLFVF